MGVDRHDDRPIYGGRGVPVHHAGGFDGDLVASSSVGRDLNPLRRCPRHEGTAEIHNAWTGSPRADGLWWNPIDRLTYSATSSTASRSKHFGAGHGNLQN